MIFIGVDPGASGAAFAVDQKGGVLSHINFAKTSDVEIQHWFLRMQLEYGRADVLLEKVHAQVTDGVKQAFTFGVNVQRVKTIMTLSGLEWNYAPPKQWMDYVGWGRIPHGKSEYKRRKKMLYTIARELAPEFNHFTVENADAYLIAYYHCKSGDLRMR